MLNGRLCFGCARLTGGATEREADALMRLCLDAGIGWFDTAPPYGLGTAEAVVGRAIANRPDVRVTIKLGLRRERFGLSKTWLRRVRRLGRARAALLPAGHEPQLPRSRNPKADFTPDAIRRSLAISLARLGRTRTDLLLLHEAYAGDASADTIAALADWRRQSVVDAIGYSHGAIYDKATAAAFPASFTAQVGILPDWLSGGAAIPDRPLVLHSIAKTGQYLKRIDTGFAQRLATLAQTLTAPGIDGPATEIALLFVLAHARAPHAGLIFASADRGRLAALLAALAHVEATMPGAAIAHALAPAEAAA